jgi:hypothetical protein
VWRVVESQQRISTRQLVDSDAEHELLEELIEASKPAVPESPEFAGLHFLLQSPFRYPPLPHGSRFGGRHERSLWYGSEELETALAELAYYRLLFFEGTTAALLPNRVPMSAFQAVVRSTSAVDLTRAPFDAHRELISSKTAHAETQRLGSEMRAAGVELVRYASARDAKQRPNVALFTPAAFAVKRPRAPQTWHCTVTASRAVSWMREGVSGLVKHEFARESFLVDGSFPAPAV